jgi:hypothetical protein
MSYEEETVAEPMVDGSFVETAFGREDFNPTEDDNAKRVYRDKASSKANGIESRKVREWARANGFPVKTRGKFTATVVQRYIEENK